jgi:hypothetical protein
MSDDALLHEKARELIRAGKLPSRRPERVWGGSGFGGSHCALCGVRIRPDEIALEVEVRNADGARTSYSHLHVHCFSVLESELHGRPASPDSGDGSGRRDDGTMALGTL